MDGGAKFGLKMVIYALLFVVGIMGVYFGLKAFNSAKDKGTSAYSTMSQTVGDFDANATLDGASGD